MLYVVHDNHFLYTEIMRVVTLHYGKCSMLNVILCLKVTSAGKVQSVGQSESIEKVGGTTQQIMTFENADENVWL